MDTLHLINLDLLDIKELVRSPESQLKNLIIERIHMDIKHIPWCGVSDLQVKVVQGYRPIGINGSCDPYTKDIIIQIQRVVSVRIP